MLPMISGTAHGHGCRRLSIEVLDGHDTRPTRSIRRRLPRSGGCALVTYSVGLTDDEKCHIVATALVVARQRAKTTNLLKSIS